VRSFARDLLRETSGMLGTPLLVRDLLRGTSGKLGTWLIPRDLLQETSDGLGLIGRDVFPLLRKLIYTCIIRASLMTHRQTQSKLSRKVAVITQVKLKNGGALRIW